MESRHSVVKRLIRALNVVLLIGLVTACGPDVATPIGNAHATEGLRIDAPAARIAEPKTRQVAVFAGGCFWGIESGYSGDTKATAYYNLVSAGQTKHAESVRIHYDPTRVSYNDLLHIFFSVAHDPTQLNRQGPDRGLQYRTAIFPANVAQRNAASAYIAQLDKAAYWKRPIVTKLEPFSFFPAETYHQDFMAKNPRHPYIVQWDKPKIANLNRLFPSHVRYHPR
jgi:peptide-methionine (S)-S-oxide reductase